MTERSRRLTDAQRDLAAEYYALAKSIVRKYANRYPCQFESIVDAGHDALMRAVRKYQPEYGSFAAFARQVIDLACFRAVRKPKRQRDQLPLYYADPHQINLTPVGPSVQAIDTADLSRLNLLTDRQKQATLLIYGYEFTFQKTADLMGVTVGTVQNLNDSAKKRAMRELTHAGDQSA